MTTFVQVVLDLTAVAFVGLGVGAVVEWYRQRGRAAAMLALSLSLLGVVAILGRLQALTGNSPWIGAVTLIAFLGCGYFVLLFRDAFVPLRPREKVGARGLFVAAGLIGIGLTVFSHAPVPVLTVATLFVVLTWGVFIGEPIFRFWTASRGLPAVQRIRMRTLSFGFGGLVLVVLIAAIGGTAIQSPGWTIAIQLIALAMVPVIYVSVTPPTILRNIWRMGETAKLRDAIQDLLIFSPNPRVLAEQAVGWAMRMLGAHAAFIVDPEGKVMARRNVTEPEIADILKRRQAGAMARSAPDGANLLVAPLHLTEGTGYIGVIAGPFTPLFGSDEISQLQGYATSVAAGIERTRVTERMATIEKHKSQFLNLASHELRGPMTVIRGYGSMLQSGMFGHLNERGRKAADVMMAKITEMNGMIEQMIEAARLEDESLMIKPQDADLRDIVRAAADSVRPLLDETHPLTVHVPSRAVPVKVDVERIQTIVSNLIDNAVKYSPGGGEVTVTVTSRGGLGRVAVKDGGVGIAPADMATLFTRFGRVANPKTDHLPGTGLGLYLGRQLARLHGGDVTVESVAGEGSTFTLHLPAGERTRAVREAQAVT